LKDKAIKEKAEARDWTSVREWTNLAVGGGALLVAIVSVWTTAQISGIEDYFRSEISRRNSDLNSLADQARRLGTLADERERRLAQLQTSTERITASNLAAQGKLISTQEELSRLGFEVLSAKQTIATSKASLASLSAQSNQQKDLIDLFRRQRFFEKASLRLLFRGIWSEQNNSAFDGEIAFQTITNWAAADVDPDLAAYLPDFRAKARRTCEWIRTYKPVIPEQQPYPKGPAMPGKLVDNGTARQMTQKEYQAWTAAQEAWNKRWSEVSEANRRAFEASQKAREFLSKATATCVCQALVTANHPASAICPGYEKPPERPS
jgi:hypothetical protein